ncbi:protein STAY-GREEN, chloroplastic [Amborella trichopoda]|uniref:protein STAY-GREEN, chloroplastic n=1 Tax=Amborella trichopoda TaxID=13333 RepID=UPI0009BFD302|nr:protein STAY-GREEN, chloroplastic [Amborella trichopoda]|eukprot:XP_020524486.1 protein STAY-GREEN, chloroplastic [Amborella trichopoda]
MDCFVPTPTRISAAMPKKRPFLHSANKCNRAFFIRSSSPIRAVRFSGPPKFEASKLKVVFLGVDQEKHPGTIPRTYTLTHSDITADLNLAISHSINRNQLQGWYNKLQRDYVIAEWKKVQGKMSLHVHCHISGGHLLLNLVAGLRFHIFQKELPLVLKALIYGDGVLFKKHPELKRSLVWVYFHSNLKEYNRVECWGPLQDAAQGQSYESLNFEEWKELSQNMQPKSCGSPCNCCFPPLGMVPFHHDLEEDQQHFLSHQT